MEATSEVTSQRCKRQSAPPECTAPWLLLQHGADLKDQTFYVLSPLPYHKYYVRKRIPELSGNKIVGCRYGWLLLMDGFEGKELCLLNTVTLDTILLPSLEHGIKTFPLYSLTAPPDDFNCLVLLLDEDRAIFCHPRRDDRWTVQKTLIEGTGDEIVILDLVSCNGVIYASSCLEDRSRLVSVEFVHVQPEAQPLMTIRLLELELPYTFSCTLRLFQYLVESRGQLFVVSCHFNLRDIHRVDVYMLDKDISGNGMTWTEVKNLTNHAFFIGNSCSASLWLKSCEPAGLLRENSIYFTFAGDEGLYRYGLDDRSFTPFLLCHNLLKLPHEKFWVVPLCHQRTRVEEEYCKYRNDSIGKGTIQLRVMGSTSRHEDDVEDNDSGTNGSVFSALPLDIIELFARCLPLPDCLNFRAVCKRCLKAAPRIDWMTTSIMSKREDHTYFTPSLLFLDRADGRLCHLIHVSPVTDFYKRATITFSSKGWLLLYTDDGVLQAFNPVTGARKTYPKDFMPGPIWGFSTFPTSPDCVVVGMYGIRPNFLYIRHGDVDWNHYEPLNDGEVSFENDDSTPVYYEGAFYFLDRKGYLGSLGFTEDGCNWKIVTKESPCRRSCQEAYLVECDGKLVSVFVGKFGKWIEIFRLHHPTMTWEKVESLGGHMLFLARVSSFAIPAISAGMENRIYFIRILGARALYYSLDTGKYYYSGCENPVEDFCNSRQLLQSCWIEPTI